jgi:hypothetical protein
MQGNDTSIAELWLVAKATAKPKPDADFADVTRINHKEEWKNRVIGTTCGSGWCFGSTGSYRGTA